MSNWLKVALLCLVSFAGYTLPSVTPDKVKFSSQPIPEETQLCKWEKQSCQSKNYQLTLITGDFSPLRQTLFTFSETGSDPRTELYISSDDQRFGVIEARRNKNGLYSAFIPFCSNRNMKIILFSDSKSALTLPAQR
jgi:hypothetical protein